MSHVVSSDVAFTPAVKEVQRRRGSRRAYERVEEGGGWRTEVDAELAAFIAAQTSCFLGTAEAAGEVGSRPSNLPTERR